MLRSGRGHFTSGTAFPPTHHPITGTLGLRAKRRNTALEQISALLVITMFPIQLLDSFKTHLLSTLYLN